MLKKYLKKSAITLLILSIGCLAYNGLFDQLVVRKTWLGRIDENAGAYIDRTLKNALITFAVVRGLNAVISVIQDSELAVSPAGMGITVAVGEVLDPVNDIIERFSWVMLAATTSLGIQKILMAIGAWLGFKVLLILALLVLLAGLWIPAFPRWRTAGYKLIVLAVIARFIVPVSAIATSRIDDLFLEEKYRQATDNLEKAGREIEIGDIPDAPASGETGLITQIRTLFRNISNSIQLEDRIAFLREKMGNYIQHILDLIIVFILQTILLPLLFLWILLHLTRSLISHKFIDTLEATVKNRISGDRRHIPVS